MADDVTVIVVGYNHSRYITECFQSIRSQGSRVGAVIVADDASTDDSREVIESFAKKHPGFLEFFPNETNRGLTWTLNRALARVQTEYVTYIAADDLMLAGRIERQAALMDMSHAELTYTDALVIDAASNVVHSTSKTEFPWPDPSAAERKPMQFLFEANWVPAASIMMRTQALKDIGGYNERIFFEDYELLTRAGSHGWRFVALDEPLVAVRRLQTSLGTVGFRGDSARFIVAHDAALRHFPADGSDLARRVASARWELAKRASRLDLDRTSKLEMISNARRGAGSPLTFAYHYLRVFLRQW